jgi:hypothetical protein
VVAMFIKIKLIASGRKNLVIISMKITGYEIWMPNVRDILIIKLKYYSNVPSTTQMEVVKRPARIMRSVIFN